MRDWKGNEIKVGHTVSIYQYNNPFVGSSYGIAWLTKDNSHYQELGGN